jgi:hypothetical protein
VKTLILISGLLLSLNIAGQEKKDIYRISRIDTLESNGDSVLVKITELRNEVLFSEKIGFIFPGSIKLPRYRFAHNIFKTRVPVLRFVRHGISKEYTFQGNLRQDVYSMGSIVSTQYYSDKKELINREQYFDYSLTVGPCGRIGGEYFILPKTR